jgi:hypothetical protein
MSALISNWNVKIDLHNSEAIESAKATLNGILNNCGNDRHCQQIREEMVRDDQREIDKAIAKYQQEKGKGGVLQADRFATEVVKKGNYEGNVIAYLRMRAKGTDDASHEKITCNAKMGSGL